MSSFVHTEVEGINDLLKFLKKYDQKVQKAVENAIKAAGVNVAREATKNERRVVAYDRGHLATSIQMNYLNALNVEVVANKEYAPYVEFGTGTMVEVPKGLEDYAMQFKGQGIKKVNLPARPYLFPAYFAEIPKMISKIKEALNNV